MDSLSHFQRGLDLERQGLLDEAAACYAKATEINSRSVESLSNLGNLLRRLGQFEQAEECLRRAIAINPAFYGAVTNLGVLLSAQGRWEEAVDCYGRAVSIRPDLAEAQFNLGTALRAQQKLEPAIASYRKAIELDPRYTGAWINVGNALKALGNATEAISCYERALEIEPGNAVALSNLGNALKDAGRLDEALACHQRAVEEKPGMAEAQSNLGSTLRALGQIEDAIAAYRRAIEISPRFVRAHSNLAYAVHFSTDYDSAAIFTEQRRFQDQHAAALAVVVEPHANDPSLERRLRIGYVSADFRHHAQSLFTLPLFTAHDHERFEIVCYSGVGQPDAETARIRAAVDAWREAGGLSDEQLATLIREDGVDILVDLAMHMEGNRLLVFARRPAPVQVTWLAYPGTTGLTAMDYRLTDQYLDPPGMFERFYSEKSVRLPDAFWCYGPHGEQPVVGPLPAASNGYVTFGSLNHFAKVNDGVLQVWGRVLAAVRDSRLLVLAPTGSARQRVLSVLETEGIGADRVRFVGRQARLQYLDQYNQIDIGLDTFPANGHTTSLDAFWMGVPVVTLAGQTAIGLGGVSILSNLGLEELIAQTPEDFVGIAARLASDLDGLTKLRSSLRQRLQESPLMDAPRFARGMEAAFRQMWHGWCSGTQATGGK